MALAQRRAEEHKRKSKAKIIAKGWGIEAPTTKILAKIYATHGAICSCKICGNPRRHRGEKTLSEQRNEIRNS